MREILFRGKRVDNNEWAYGDLEHNSLGVPDCVDGFLIITETVGQFTGLTANGKKIFEGDIVKEKDCVHNGKIQIKGKIFTVEYKEGVFIMVYPERLFKSYLYLMANDIEVIGNIYDNQELLKEEV